MEPSSSFVQPHEFLSMCNHFRDLISDPIGKQSAMSKRGQEATSSEGSPMAKPKPMVPAKTRPVNLVSHTTWSARENPPQDSGYPVDPVNADEGQGSHASTRKLVRAVTLKAAFQNMKKTNHRYMTKFFHFFQRSWDLKQVLNICT